MAATTQAERQAQVLAAGYNGPLTDAAVNQAYANAATPSDLAASGISNTPSGGGGGGGGAVPQTYGGVSQADLQRIQSGFAASSGLSIKQLNETMREFDQNLDWQKQMWQQQGLPQLAIQQRAQDLEEKKEADLTSQSARQQAFVEEQGRRQATLAEKTQSDANAIAQGQLAVSQGQLGVQQGQLGADVLKTAASLTGPADWIKAANFSRGVAQTNLPAFITNLLSGQSTGVLGGPAPGATPSAAVSLGGLAAGMGAGVPGGPMQFGAIRAPTSVPTGGNTSIMSGANAIGAGGSNVDYAANQLRKLYAAGGQALGPQALEGLTPSEMAMMQGGGADLGQDVQGYLAQYQRSRIGQQAATPGMTV